MHVEEIAAIAAKGYVSGGSLKADFWCFLAICFFQPPPPFKPTQVTIP